ncbi:MAG: hypothetical protein JST93_14700 [Acidobacteria bacterium]|nr:hypothetical protein [Acidobacteriota bacterium]
MNTMKRVFTAAAAIGLTTGVFGQSVQQPAVQIPTATFEVVFRHIQFLKQRSEQRVAKGTTGTKARDYYKESAQLSPAEADSLETLALTVVKELDAFDERAAAIIRASRPVPLNRRLLPGERPPSPPQELLDLQQRRDAVVQNLRERLKQALGTGAFSKLEQSLTTQFKTGGLKTTATTQKQRP